MPTLFLNAQGNVWPNVLPTLNKSFSLFKKAQILTSEKLKQLHIFTKLVTQLFNYPNS